MLFYYFDELLVEGGGVLRARCFTFSFVVEICCSTEVQCYAPCGLGDGVRFR